MRDRGNGLLQIQRVRSIEDRVDIAERQDRLSLFGTCADEGGRLVGRDGDRAMFDRVSFGDRSGEVGFEQRGRLSDRALQLDRTHLVSMRTDLLVHPGHDLDIEMPGQVRDPSGPPRQQRPVQDSRPDMFEPIAQLDCVPEELLAHLGRPTPHSRELHRRGLRHQRSPGTCQGQHPVPERIRIQPPRLLHRVDRMQRREPGGGDQHIPISLLRGRARRTHRSQQTAGRVARIEECFHDPYFTRAQCT